MFPLLHHLAAAQANENFVQIKTGDQFSKQTFINSNILLQQETQALDASSKVAVTQLFTVNAVSDEAYFLTVKTTRIVDSVNALGKQHYYTSESLKDSASIVEKTIKSIINNCIKLEIKKNGVVPLDSSSGNDPVVGLVGLELHQYLTGNLLKMLANRPRYSNYPIGYVWIDSETINNRTSHTTYTLEAKTKTTTTVSFISKMSETFTNTNTNGSMIIDNHSGLILERAEQSITIGYQLLNGVICALDKRTATSESIVKLNN